MRTTGLYLLNALLWPALVLLGVLYLCPFGPVFFAFFLATRRGNLHDAARAYVWLTGRCYVRALSPLIRFEAAGLENVPQQGPCVFVLNHRAWVDILCASLQPHANAAVAVRAWPFRLPVLGAFMRLAEYIPVEKHSFTTVARQAARLARRGTSLVFFPEGHRSRTGELQRLRAGAFILAERFNLPVVPVCIEGSERVAPVGSRLLRPGRVRVRVLPPIRPDLHGENRSHRSLRRRVRRAFEEHLSGRRPETGDGRHTAAPETIEPTAASAT